VWGRLGRSGGAEKDEGGEKMGRVWSEGFCWRSREHEGFARLFFLFS